MIQEFSPESLPEWPGFGALPDLEKARLGPTSVWLETGQLRTFVLEEDGRTLGRVTAFVNPRLQDQPVPTGLIGFLTFADEAFERHEERLRELVGRAFAWLASRGMKRVRGPMNFTTWYSYRAETWSGDYPRFPGEEMPDQRYAKFLGTLMKPAGTYASQLVDDHHKAQAVARQLGIDRAGSVSGVRVEHLPREQVLGDMQSFFDLASQIFPADYSYGPIAFSEFLQMYTPVIQRAPDLYCLVAKESGGRPVGLAYGYRHPFAPVKTSILKSVGVLPEYRRGLSRGISWFLVYHYHMNLIEQGYEHFVHATMKEDNTSRAMSSRFASKIREYSLYEAELAAP